MDVASGFLFLIFWILVIVVVNHMSTDEYIHKTLQKKMDAASCPKRAEKARRKMYRQWDREERWKKSWLSRFF